MAKILKSGSLVPTASPGRFAAGISGVAAGAFMVAGWAAGISVPSPALFTGLLGSWPVGMMGVGAIAAAGLWLLEGRSAPASPGQGAISKREVGVMASPVMVSPQVAFAQSRVK